MTRTTIVRIPYFTGVKLKLRQRKHDGEFVAVGDILYTIDFDATGLDSEAEVDIETVVEGKLRWLIKDNCEVNFGDEIATIEE